MEVLEHLALGKNLSEAEALKSFRAMYTGEMPASCVGAFLMGLKTKGETGLEIACGVKAALEEARLIPGLTGDRIDTCGTGGDNTCSFNCSTAVALYLAAMGHQVVKHGNRSVSSTCGSADIVEALGLSLVVEPEAVTAALAASNFVFLFAPNFHPAFKRIMPIRKELGARTLFNLMGPLLNPARPTHQLLGVPTAGFVPLIAEALSFMDVRHAVVVHGAGGFDELSPFGPAEVCWVRDGWMRRERLEPQDYGIPRHKLSEVAVASKDEAVAVLLELLRGEGPAAMKDMLALNLGTALHLLEEDLSLQQGIDKARDAIVSKVAAAHWSEALNA